MDLKGRIYKRGSTFNKDQSTRVKLIIVDLTKVDFTRLDPKRWINKSLSTGVDLKGHTYTVGTLLSSMLSKRCTV